MTLDDSCEGPFYFMLLSSFSSVTLYLPSCLSGLFTVL